MSCYLIRLLQPRSRNDCVIRRQVKFRTPPNVTAHHPKPAIGPGGSLSGITLSDNQLAMKVRTFRMVQPLRS
jgi:hypothetical protein